MKTHLLGSKLRNVPLQYCNQYLLPPARSAMSIIVLLHANSQSSSDLAGYSLLSPQSPQRNTGFGDGDIINASSKLQMHYRNFCATLQFQSHTKRIKRSNSRFIFPVVNQPFIELSCLPNSQPASWGKMGPRLLLLGSELWVLAVTSPHPYFSLYFSLFFLLCFQRRYDH